jgi:enoyl-CoA hydratase/carnithine racemase
MTGRMFDAEEALRVGLVSHLVAPGGKENVISEAVKLATEMASLSPLAVSGTKMALNYARDHPVPQALEHVATWNAAALHTDDLSIAQGGATSRAPGSRTPSIYSNL